MSLPDRTTVVSFPVRTASGVVADIMVRPGAWRTLAELDELREIVREHLPPGWTLGEEGAES